MIIIDELINKKLAKYYKGNEISKSLKSMIHVETIYKMQLPDKVWDLIKQFMIYDKEYYKVVMESKNGYIIKNGKFFTIPRVFNNLRLTELDLDDNQIKDITALTNALSTNTTLTTLSLWKNQITDITALANALSTNTKLTTLRFGCNPSPLIRQIQRDAQSTNTTLTELSLRLNQITDITALGNALKTNSTLTELYLGGNQITDIKALANALSTNAKLTFLYLNSNQITDITALANALLTNTTLFELHLWSNQITDIKALANALKTNSTLKRLWLFDNQIADNDKDILRRAWTDAWDKSLFL
tara:strand:- start:1218 stop:2126 length:909 start_codon:yes stop_codon:yes gene_type:complete